jgi:CRISPR-associated protein Cmr1
MQSITFTCETITPMFMSGTNTNEPELRAPSIKGALRFWWRAMNGHLSLEDLKAKEDELFGGTDNRSKVTISIKNPTLPYSTNPFPDKLPQKTSTYFKETRTYTDKRTNVTRPQKQYNINILNYLAFGIADFKGNLNRPYILPESEFVIKIKILNEEFVEEILQTFIMMSIYGGLGAKSHNGFGCFKITKAIQNSISIDIDKYKLFSTKSSLAKYTTFSNNSALIFEKEIEGDWADALACIGKKYQKARETVEAWHFYDKRKLLAAPIIVGKGYEATKTDLERHAKPYFLHIEKIAPKKYLASIYCMPYDYLANSPFNKNLNIPYQSAIVDFNKLLKK